MPNTTNFQIAYPAGTDYVKDGATAMGTIANGFDSLLGTVGLGGLQNAIINGDFSVNQRVFSSTTSTTAYGHDRWQLLKFGGTTTYSNQAFALGSPAASGYETSNYARVVTSGQSGAGDHSILRQAIENVRTFAGAPVAVSFWARAGSGTPSIAVELGQYFGTGGTPSVDVNTLLGKVQLSTNWTRYQLSVTLPNLSTKVLGTNGDHYLTLNFWTSAGSTFNTRTGTLGIQNATIEVWGVQVERGTRATPFERRPPGVELMLCQRYYQKSYNVLTAPGSVSQNGALTCFYNSGYGASQGFQFRTTMRKNPILTLYSPNTGAGNRVDSIGSGDSTYTLGEIGESGIRYLIAAAGTNGVVFHYVAESDF